ncbi:MAG: TetR/AcrR family transcriptional regulator [Bdellovibrionales bacterium]
MPFLNRQSTDTKTKIMEVAFELFGKEGFEGTSIREIARLSGANLAAVNYHFKTKENLFWEVMAAIYKEVHLAVEQFASESKNTKELALKTYDYFLHEKTAVRATMKMMLIDLKPPEDLSDEALKILNNPMGPPGGEFFAQMLMKEIPYQLSREGVMWGVKSIFGVVHHWAVLFTCPAVMEDKDPLMSEEQIRKDVESMLDSHLIYLMNNKNRFS